jgi:hypothetical protein
MKKFGKLVLGLISVWPILYMVLFIVFICGVMMIPSMHEGSESEGPGFGMIGFFAVHGFTMLLMLFLLTFYIIHTIRNPKLEGLDMLVWILILAMLGIITIPIYWYVHIWKEGSIRLIKMKKKKM